MVYCFSSTHPCKTQLFLDQVTYTLACVWFEKSQKLLSYPQLFHHIHCQNMLMTYELFLEETIKIQFESLTHSVLIAYLDFIQSNWVDRRRRSNLEKLNNNLQQSIIKEQTEPCLIWIWFSKYVHWSYKQWKKEKSRKYHAGCRTCTGSWCTGTIWIGYRYEKDIPNGRTVWICTHLGMNWVWTIWPGSKTHILE